MALTNITDFNPATGRTTTTLVADHDRGALDYYTPGASIIAATGAVAGKPGHWTPAGSNPPANAAAATGITASPATAWTAGQYVQGSTSGAAGRMSWSGTNWVGGAAPAAAEAEPEPEVEGGYS